MVEAQTRIQTAKLFALMIMAAVIGFLIDQIVRLIERRVTSWRFKDARS
jgi:ABC-type nitrate/sulfonate/bicarbonate transport system permease component